LHTGRHSLLEIGHVQVDPYGKRCCCGNHGCLETVTSIENLLEIAQQRLGASMNSSLHRLPLSRCAMLPWRAINWPKTLSLALAIAW